MSNWELTHRLNTWLHQRRLKTLEEACRGAEEIAELETQYFNGEKIAMSPGYSKTIYDYVKSLRDRRLLEIRSALTQFRLNSFLLNQPVSKARELQKPEGEAFESNGSNPVASDADGSHLQLQIAGVETLEEPELLEKLNYIESVIGKYRPSAEVGLQPMSAPVQAPEAKPAQQSKGAVKDGAVKDGAVKDGAATPADPLNSTPLAANASTKRNRAGLFGGGFGLVGQPNADYERRVVQTLRLERKQMQAAIRWLIILVLAPLLVGLISRHFVLEPLLGSYSDRYPNRVELSNEIQEEFALKLNQYKEQLEIQELLGMAPELTPEMKRDEVSEKATELWREAREEELNGLKNVLADVMALITFTVLVCVNRTQMTVLKNVINRTFLGLSDPLKVFVFILVTDMFVGFHSAEGWAVILEALGKHLGFPENEAAVGLFIATVPVILDAYVKFWIFNYLTRYSPSSSAILERMNT